MHPLFQILHIPLIIMPGSRSGRRPLPILRINFYRARMLVVGQRLRATSSQTTGKKDSL